MKISNKKWWLRITLGLILIFIITTFKVEHIEEVCGKTGSSIRYNRYFSVITTEKQLTSSWVEKALNIERIALPDRDWHKTVGDTWTIFKAYRGHGSAPATYILRAFDLKSIQEELGREETINIAKLIAFGGNAQQQEAINQILLIRVENKSQ